MSIFPMGQNEMDGIGNLGCDSAADIPNLPAYAESNNLKPGTTCTCIDTSEVYAMKSDKTWKVL